MTAAAAIVIAVYGLLSLGVACEFADEQRPSAIRILGMALFWPFVAGIAIGGALRRDARR